MVLCLHGTLSNRPTVPKASWPAFHKLTRFCIKEIRLSSWVEMLPLPSFPPRYTSSLDTSHRLFIAAESKSLNSLPDTLWEYFHHLDCYSARWRLTLSFLMLSKDMLEKFSSFGANHNLRRSWNYCSVENHPLSMP